MIKTIKNYARNSVYKPLLVAVCVGHCFWLPCTT